MSDNKQAQKLIQASLKGDVSQIEDLLSKNVDVNSKNAHSQFPLLVASQHGHKDAVKLLILRGAHVNMESRNKVTALSLASECGHHEIVDILIENKAHINHQVSGGRTALMLASQNGHEETAGVLLAKNANVNLSTDDNQTALTFALRNTHIEVAKVLLTYIPVSEVDRRDSNGMTPLMIASSRGLVDITELLLKKEARVNLRTFKGSTSLILASESGNPMMAEVLLKYGANPNILNDRGYSALITASRKGHKDFVKTLLSYGAQVNFCIHSTGETALIVASKHGHKEIVKLLICDEKTQCHGGSADKFAPADINIIDEKGWTALIVFCSHGDVDMVETLIRHGADVSAMKQSAFSALASAIKSRNADVVRLLLENKASVEYEHILIATELGLLEILNLIITPGVSVDRSGYHRESALWVAVRNGYTSIVNFLLEKGASVDNVKMSGNRTPALVLATVREDVEIVKALLSKGAAVDVRTCGYEQQVTPLMLAIYAGHTEMVELFIEHGADIYFKMFKSKFRQVNFTCKDLANAVGIQTVVCKKAKLDPEQSVSVTSAHDQAAPSSTAERMIEIVQQEYIRVHKTIVQLSNRLPSKSSSVEHPSLLCLFPEIKPEIAESNRDSSSENEDSEDSESEDELVYLLRLSAPNEIVCTSDQPTFPINDVPPTHQDAYLILLPVASKWKNIGVLLGIEYGKLMNIETDKKDSQNALLEMIVEWLKKIDPLPTWDELAKAVKPFDQTIAKQIRDKYCV